MDPNQNTQQESSGLQGGGSGVSFPAVNEPRRSGGSKMLLIVGILVLVGVLGFVIYKSATTNSEDLPEPTPFDNLTVAPENQPENPLPTPTATSSATPKPADKEEVEIQIQNGTGIAGEAAFLQTQLKALGYSDIKVGNAGTQTLTATEVTFSKSLDSAIVSEITQKLNSIYQSVTVKTSTTQSFEVLIITGLKKGATANPSSTPASTSSPSPTPSPTPTPTATP